MTEQNESEQTPTETSIREPLILPVLPLRELVLFPGITVPIAVGRAGTLKAIEAARSSGGDPLVLAVTQRKNTTKVTPDELYSTGTVARIEQVQRSLSGIQVILRAERRGRAVRFEHDAGGGYLTAAVRDVEELLPADLDDPAFVALYREAQARDDAAQVVPAFMPFFLLAIVVYLAYNSSDHENKHKCESIS